MKYVTAVVVTQSSISKGSVNYTDQIFTSRSKSKFPTRVLVNNSSEETQSVNISFVKVEQIRDVILNSPLQFKHT